MSSSPPAADVSRDEVERTLVELLRGRTSRQKVGAWVQERLAELDGEIADPAVWTTLSLLSGLTLKIAPDVFLHDDEQIADWLAEFRQARKEDAPAAPEGLRAMRALTDELPYVVARERARRLASETLPVRRRLDRKPPQTTCHVLASSGGDTLCGLDGGQLIVVAAVATLDDVPEALRCPDCSWRLRAGIS